MISWYVRANLRLTTTLTSDPTRIQLRKEYNRTKPYIFIQKS